MQSSQLKRRKFLAVLGGAAAWPIVARAQQGERVRRISVLVPAAANDPVWQARIGGHPELGAVTHSSVLSPPL